MSHVEMMEIVLQGYMPEVERAPWSPDSWAPASQQLTSSGAGLSRGEDSAAVTFIHLLPPGNCAVGAAALPWQWGQCPWAAAGQREVRYEGTGGKHIFALSH